MRPSSLRVGGLHTPYGIILEQFGGEAWRTRELLEELSHCRDFYFDKMCQIRMPSWTKGRVALVGDAAYCASPAAGMGGSLAIVGATALADAFQKHPRNFEAAFQEYKDSLRSFVEDVQTQAVNFGLEMFLPRSKEALQRRNARFSIDGFRAFSCVWAYSSESLTLKEESETAGRR